MKRWLEHNLPVIVQPQCDVDNGYGLVGVFARVQQSACHLRLLYEGETTWNRNSPEIENIFGSLLYRSFNYLVYRRTGDVNQLCMEGIDLDQGKQPWDHIWTVDHNGSQTWSRGTKRDLGFVYSLMHHYDLHCYYEEWELFDKDGTRPIVYVNTGNHMHGHVDMNPSMQKCVWKHYPVWEGGSEEAELFCQTQIKHRWNLLTPLSVCFKRYRPPDIGPEAFKKIPLWSCE